MQAIGNAITVLGILVTFVAYFGQHSAVTLAQLEPGLAARWHQLRGWVDRRLGRTRSVTVHAGAAWSSSAALAATAIGWSPDHPGEDIAVRVDKLARHLDALRIKVEERRAHDQQRIREITDGLSERVTELDQRVAAHDEVSRRLSTAAMRWEVRGLLITLVGAGLGILG